MRVLLLALLLAASCAAPTPAPIAAPLPKLEDLRVSEEAAARLQVRLDAFTAAVNSRDESAMRASFADSVAYSFPGEMAVPWSTGCAATADEPILRFEGGAAPSRFDGTEAARRLSTFLAKRSIEHVEGVVIGLASVVPLLTDSPGPQRSIPRPAGFRLTIVGRDDQGRRESISGRGSFDLAGERIAALDLHESRLVATRELFVDVSAQAGVERADPSLMDRGGRGLLSHGVAAGDVDNDGLIDVVATGLAQHALYRNRADGTFEDVAEAARIAHSAHPSCAPLLFDADGDGDEDLFLSGIGGNSLFENRLVPDGKLEFRDVSSAAGVEVERDAFSVAVGDVSGDGKPDLAVACYGDYGPVVPNSWVAATNGQANLLFLNESSPEGGLKFREAAKELGCDDSRWSYAVLLADVDSDGDLDEIVANDFGGDLGLYVNDGGHFTDRAAERGLAGAAYAMGLSLGDPDCDGDLDLFVTKASSVAPMRMFTSWSMRPESARLLVDRLARGDTIYEKLGDRFRQDRFFATGWSWGGGFVDLDGDGWTDLHVPGGFLTGTGPGDTDDAFWEQVVESLTPGGRTPQEFFAMQVPAILHEGASFAGHERDSVFLNARGCFTDVSGVTGLDSDTDGRGAAYADFDDDGDPDIFLRAMHSRAHILFRNDLGGAHGFVRIALQGTRSGRDACGAIVRVHQGARVVAQAKLCGSGFLSQSDPRLLFGVDGPVDSIDVAWPSGAKQSFGGVSPGSSILIVEGETAPRVVKEHAFRLGGSP